VRSAAQSTTLMRTQCGHHGFCRTSYWT
jgi:hypothetical protein